MYIETLAQRVGFGGKGRTRPRRAPCCGSLSAWSVRATYFAL